MYFKKIKNGHLLSLTVLLVSFSLMSLSLSAAFACQRENTQFGDSRVISVDMQQAFGFGSMRGHKALPLKDKEVVLTFDDGPWHGTTPKILKVLDKYCSHAIFFPIGKHAKRFPELMRRVQQRGHTVGSHTWSHSYAIMGGDKTKAVEDIMHGARVVAKTAQISLPRFFRYPGFKERRVINKEIRKKNFVVFSSDIDSVDWRMKSSRALIDRIMTLLNKKRKGILILHDNKKLTANTLDYLLSLLKRNGYKIVHVKTKAMMRVAEASLKVASVVAKKPLTFKEKQQIAQQMLPLAAIGTPSRFLFQSVASSAMFQNVSRHRVRVSVGLVLLLLWLSLKFTLPLPASIFTRSRRRGDGLG